MTGIYDPTKVPTCPTCRRALRRRVAHPGQKRQLACDLHGVITQKDVVYVDTTKEES